ncbi:hypothetical protein QYF36_010717 [Acer negundo]|nr:hypothetical protein QYF36_010717 [Acer negundo]
MDRIVLNTVLNNKAGVQPLAAVEQNQVPPRVTIHREIIGPSNRQGPADPPAWSRNPPQKDRPQWFGTGNKTTVLRVEAKSHRRDDRKQSPSSKRRAGEEVQSEMKVTEQWKKQLSKIAKDLEELKKGKTSEEWDPLKKFYAPFSEEALELLRTSLKLKASLTSVFLTLWVLRLRFETTHKFKALSFCQTRSAVPTMATRTKNNVKNAKDIGDLEERFVEFGPDEALELLRTSLKSRASLTNVFLMKKKEVYEGEGRLRTAEEDRIEALERKLKMVMDDQERMRVDMEIMVNAVLNNTAAVQPLVAVDQNQVPPRVTIHREIIGPSNRQGPADQPARCISPSRPGTGSKTIVSRTKAKSHRRDVRKQSPSAKRRAVEEEDEGEEVQLGMRVEEQFKKQFSIIAKEPEELKKGKASEEKDPLNEFNAPLSEESPGRSSKHFSFLSKVSKCFFVKRLQWLLKKAQKRPTQRLRPQRLPRL